MKRNLKIKFLLYVSTLIFIAMSISTLFAYRNSKDALNKAIAEQLNRIVVSTADNIAFWMHNRKLDFINWSQQNLYQIALEDSYLGRTACESACSRLEDKKRNYKYYESLNLANTHGKIVSSSNKDIVGKIGIYDEQFFQASLHGDTFLSSVMKSPETGKNALVISVPVNKDGVVTGVLYGVIDVDAFNGLFITPIKIGKTGYVYLVDADGVAIAHPDKKRILKTNIKSFEFGREIMNKKSGFITYVWEGMEKIVFFQQHKDLGWIVAAGAGTKEVFAPVRKLWITNIIITLIFIFISVLLVTALYRHVILVPMDHLLKGISRFGKGELDKKINLKTGDEFGELAESFNQMAEDIKESTVSLKVLEEEQKRFHDIAKNTGDWIWELDRCGRFTYSSIMVEKVLGYEPEDVIGKYFYDFFNPDNKEELKKEVLRIFSKKEPCVGFLHNDVRKDGKIITIETNGVPIINDDKELVGYRGVNRDITERKKAEEAMKQLNRDLESTVAKVEEANDNLKKFVYVASHDLREPLRKITSFGELLKNSLDSKLCEDEAENLSYMIDGAERMSQMIEGLLSYSRVSTKGQTSQTIDLNELVEQLKKLELSVLIDEKKVTLEIPQDLPCVEADPVQIRQLLQNLIANGIKYQKKDSKPCITITCRPAEDGMVRIEVADNGIGIKSEYQSEVFKMFHRLHSRNEYEGTGIGLSVCKKIVERHGGCIGVESEYGQGSAFWFTIPAAKTVSGKQG